MSLEEVMGHTKLSSMFSETQPTQATGRPRTLTERPPLMPRFQVWMLTGDKLETATCTAKNAHLVTRNQDIHVFRLVKRFPLWGLVGVMLSFAP